MNDKKAKKHKVVDQYVFDTVILSYTYIYRKNY